MAPERILAEIDLSKEATMTKCDIWSVGVILYLLFYGVVPQEGGNISKLVKEIKKGKIQFKNDHRLPEIISLIDFI